ncbi:N-acetylmuramoyl-L-alanine amidase [Nitrosomonas supralitoralis]|uniref:N-acetylmuramoyl-L-alanine amidase AmiC n=1 Tax=Nitrosomonas supralitoralis TaxID=2116706 RepID=A0A2P7NY20_9PROT|nr:N-acetylmuramoyl-L-alanine amidase [Nitrosomonas supralitoralis]PSJ18370.1 N-acetylmuramoyl-L-alanine amidase [Nitrosomonas supralitoralis]
MLDTLEYRKKYLIAHFSNSSNATAKHRFLTPLLLILFCFWILLSQSVLAADAIIQSVRVGLTPDYTRITLESDRPLEYELSMLENPHRVVIDLNNTKLNPILHTLPQKVDAIDPFVQNIRIGQFTPHVIRLVFDLKAHVVPRTFVVPPKENSTYRLILDIYNPDKAARTDLNARADLAANADSETDVLDELVVSLIQGSNQPKPNSAQQILQHQPRLQLQPSNPVKHSGSFQAAKNRKPSTTPQKIMVPRIIIVAIDPGHGGKDPGAVGQQGTYEKDVTLAIARRLKEKIDKEPNMRAVLTRDGDYYISLPQRRINARRANADLFVSIHADANPKSHAHGSSVFTLSEHGATSTTASWLANQENSVDGDLMGGIDITSKSKDIKELLLDLSLNAAISDSVKLADYVLNQLGNINHLHKRNVEQAGFAVLKSPDIPSILVETAFLSNPKEEVKLRSGNYQNQMADAMFLGIKKYFADNPALARTAVAQTQ